MTGAETRLLEEASHAAWPPRRRTLGANWDIRFGDGLHRRRNSATVWDDAPESPAEHIARVEEAYRTEGQRPVFKLTTSSLPGLDGALAAAGWKIDAPTVVMTRPIEGQADPPRLARCPSPEWIGAFTSIAGYDERRRRALETLLDDVDLPAGYALLHHEGLAAATGLVIVDHDLAGLFEIATSPRARGQGLARRVVERLLSWAANEGAVTAYLQVEEANTAALRLYGGLGFAPQYRYWYRVPA